LCAARLLHESQLAATDAGGWRRHGGTGEEIENDLADLNEDEELPLRLSAGGLLDRPAMQLKGVGFGYDPKGIPLFKGARRRDSLHIGPCDGHPAFTPLKGVVATHAHTGVEFSVDSKSRICLLGENGAGKTTLVKLMQGELEPTQGLLERASGARIETVNQHHAAQVRAAFETRSLELRIPFARLWLA
jgi:ATP-binding cassette subfamily F protein 3